MAMGEPTVNITVSLNGMKKYGADLSKIGDDFISRTAGVFGRAGGGVAGPNAGMAGAAHNAPTGRESNVDGTTANLTAEVAAGFAELRTFTTALEKNIADLDNFAALMGAGLKSYGAVAVTAHDKYVSSDEDARSKLDSVDLGDKDDTKLETDIMQHKVFGQSSSERPA